MVLYQLLGFKFEIPTLDDIVRVVVAPIQNAVLDAMNSLVNSIVPLISQTGNWISSGVSSLTATINRAVAPIVPAVTSAITTMSSLWISNVIQRVAGIALLFDSGLKNVHDRLGALPDAWGEALRPLTTAMNGLLQGFWQWLTENVFKPIGDGLNWVKMQLEGFGVSAMNQIVSMITGVPRHSPDISLENALLMLAPILGGGLLLGVASVAGELVHPLKEMGLGNLSAFVWDLAGYKRLAGAIMNPLTLLGITVPLTWTLNSLFRPRLPMLGQVDRMYFKRKIDRDAWRRMYALNGWAEPYINAWEKSIWHTPRIYDLIRAVEAGRVDLNWAKAQLLDIGVKDEDIPFYVDLFMARILKDEKTRIKNELLSDFYAEVIGADGLSSELLSAGYLPEEVSLLIQAASRHLARLRYIQANKPKPDVLKDERARIRGELLSDFYADLIDESELRANLLEIGQVQEEVDLILQAALRHRSRLRILEEKKPKPDLVHSERLSIRTELLSDYYAGMIDASVLRAELAGIGFVDQEIEMTVQAAERHLNRQKVQEAKKPKVDLTTDERTRIRTELLDDYYEELIDANTLTSELLNTAFSAEEVTLTVSAASRHLQRVRRKADMDAWVAAYAKDLTDEDGLNAELLALGFSAERAKAVVRKAMITKMPRSKVVTTATE
jgi:hypothetical protein